MGSPLRIALVVAAVFGAWEMLFAGFMADDLMQLSVLEGVSPAAAWTSPLELYRMSANGEHVRALQNAGLVPWFFPANFEMAFLRPLSSALLAADHAVFGLHPAGYRLHGVLWALALVAAAAALFRRALPGRTGTIALFVFVLSGIQAIFCWTAARHVVIAAALGVAALTAHMRWREEGWRPGSALAALALALSLTASEAGVAVALYLLAYEAFGASGTARARISAAVPTLVVLAAYLLVWRLLGRGVSPGAGYIDPLRDPATFLIELPARLAVLVGGMVVGGSADLWVLRPDLRSALAAVGAVVSVVFAALAYMAWREAAPARRRPIGWLGAAAVAAVVPFAGTPIGTRCLLVPFVGGAALVAVVLEQWWTAWRGRPGMPYRILGAACAGIAVIHLGLAPLARLSMPVLLHEAMAERAAAAIRDAELDPTSFPTQTAVVLVAPDLIVGLHGAFYRVLHRLPMPDAWRVLSWAPGTHRFVRTSCDTLEMEVDGEGIRSATLAPGSVIALRGMEATVLATAAHGPSRVRIRFDRALDDPSLTLLAWRNGRLRRVDPPLVGGAVALP
jgi:hypothetical protein